MINSKAKEKKKQSFDSDITDKKRREKALREFKEVMHDLVLMLQEATGMETVYMYWINRARRQFVMETKATNIGEVAFRDRVPFEEHFLDDYKDITEPVTLEIGSDISADVISHYYDKTPVRFITILPFVNNKETVAVTVVEGVKSSLSRNLDKSIYAYINALGNVLNTYLEMSDLYEDQNEWVAYEDQLQFLDTKGHYAVLLQQMLATMQTFLGQGGVSLITRSMGRWVNVMNAAQAHEPLPVGMAVEERSVAQSALKSGEPEFAIHFNRNPKRISPREGFTQGATLAIPMMVNDFRKGLVLVYDENPMVFKESIKHKLINIVRLTQLKIQAKLKNAETDLSLLTNSFGAIIPDGWERVIDTQIRRLSEGRDIYHSWVGMITLSRLSRIRTQFRLDELELMQKDLVRIFNPGQFGMPGFIGFYADYTYMVFAQSKDPNDMDMWADKLRQKFSDPISLTSGKQIETGVDIGFNLLTENSGESYNVISRLKKELSA